MRIQASDVLRKSKETNASLIDEEDFSELNNCIKDLCSHLYFPCRDFGNTSSKKGNTSMSEKDLLSELKKNLNDYIGSVSGTECAFIATLDGHLLLERSRNDRPLDHVSPMAGSILGISETLASQLLDQNLQDNILIMDKNILGLFKIKDQEDSLFLGILCDRLVNLGKMITFAKSTIKNINSTLEIQNAE